MFKSLFQNRKEKKDKLKKESKEKIQTHKDEYRESVKSAQEEMARAKKEYEAEVQSAQDEVVSAETESNAEVQSDNSVLTRYKQNLNQIKEEKRLRMEEEKLKKMEKEKEKCRLLLTELDSDGNGVIDVVEGDDFGKILKLNQDKIIEIDRNYIKQFVQISNYLKTKRKSLQKVFEQLVKCFNDGGQRVPLEYGLENYLPYNEKTRGIMEVRQITGWGLGKCQDYVDNILKQGHFDGTSYIKSLDVDDITSYVEVIKEDGHVFTLLLVHAITMIQSLVSNDMITFYEIYEKFDQLNMFDSKHERDIKDLLTNVNEGLENVIQEIQQVGQDIISSIDELGFITESSSDLISQHIKEGLDSVNSSIEAGNLLTGIQTYQLYRLNRN